MKVSICMARCPAVFYVLIILLFSRVAQASHQKIPPDVWSTLYGCLFSASRVEFGCEAPSLETNFWHCTCQYDPKIVTVINCFNELLPEKTNSTLLEFSKACEEGLGVAEVSITEYWRKYDNGTKYIVPSNAGAAKPAKYYVPVALNRTMMGNYRDDMFLFENNLVGSNLMGKSIAVYWTVVFLGFALYNQIIHKYSISILNQFPKFNQTVINKIKQHLTIPNAFVQHHHQPFVINSLVGKWGWKVFSSGLMPTRLETILLMIYALINWYLLLGLYSLNPQTILFSSKTEQLLRYVADRSGIIAVDHIPILILLAGRNSVLTWFTGIPYSSLIVYHNWVSRGMFFNALVHSIAYGIISVAGGRLMYNIFQERYFFFGMVATFAAAALLLQAMHFLRSRWYETFLITHIILAVTFLVGMIFHCIKVGWIEYVVLSCAIWIFDRAIRIYKILSFGVITATLTKVSETALELRVPLGSLMKNWKPFPGCYVFAYFWLPNMFWQSHPFCLVEEYGQTRNAVLYIQVKNGVTKQLYNLVSNLPEQRVSIKVSLEGPYGEQVDLERYLKVLFVAGGTGIPGPFYHLKKLAERQRKIEPLVNHQELKLYWSNKQFTDVQWFMHNLLTLNNTNVSTTIYLTREHDEQSIFQKIHNSKSITYNENAINDNAIESNENTLLLNDQTPWSSSRIKSGSFTSLSEPKYTEKCYNNLKQFASVHFNHRPDISKIIAENCDENSESLSCNRSVAIVYCGPGVMCDEIRRVVANCIGNYDEVIDIFEELQVW